MLAVPISALRGTKVVACGADTPWYGGPTVLDYLESLDVSRDRNHADRRLPVQPVIRPQDEEHPDDRGYAGRIASGDWRVGDEVVVLPSGRRSTVAGIDVNGELAPDVVRELEGVVCWMGERALEERGRSLVKHGARTVRAIVDEVVDRIDVTTLEGEPAPRPSR